LLYLKFSKSVEVTKWNKIFTFFQTQC
jgi:hypothetical protein